MNHSSEIVNIINGWFEAVEKGDSSYADKYCSKQMRLVGTDPKEWMEGEAAIGFLKEEAKAMGGKVKIVHGETEGFTEGSVGWGIAHPTITLPNGKLFSPRWGAVLHREDGEWKIVQIHASVGVSNEQIMG